MTQKPSDIDSPAQQLIADIAADVRLLSPVIGKKTLAPEVTAAMARVARHEFVPPEQRYLAYVNAPVPIGHGQTVSQPFIVALMTDLLKPERDDVILEVGTGSGYQAAILAQLVRHVYSTEIIPALARSAEKRLRRLGITNVTVTTRDGYYGWPEHAPYDGIIVTAAAPHIPPPLVDQLRIGARLVIPVGQPFDQQVLTIVEKTGPGRHEQTELLSVAFVPLTGDGQASRPPPGEHQQKSGPESTPGNES